MTEETTSEPKTIDVTVTKKHSSALKYILIILFIVILGLLFWDAVIENYKDYKNVIQRSQIFNSEKAEPEQVVVQENEKESEFFKPTPPEIIVQEPIEPLPQQQEILSLTDRLEKLEAQNKALTLYIATRELKEKIRNQADFAVQLDFVSTLSIGEADIEGRIDLLKQASENGIPTNDLLLSDLKKIAAKIEDKQEKTFWGSVKNSFNGLVKVTKIKGKVDGANYQEVIKRIELALQNEDYKTAITEAENLGADGAEFVKKLNNLQRVIEITDSLVEFSKTQFSKERQENSGDIL